MSGMGNCIRCGRPELAGHEPTCPLAPRATQISALRAKLKQAERERDEARNSAVAWTHTATERGVKLFEAQARIELLEEALEFYSKDSNYDDEVQKITPTHYQRLWHTDAISRDRGSLARAALPQKKALAVPSDAPDLKRQAERKVVEAALKRRNALTHFRDSWTDDAIASYIVTITFDQMDDADREFDEAVEDLAKLPKESPDAAISDAPDPELRQPGPEIVEER